MKIINKPQSLLQISTSRIITEAIQNDKHLKSLNNLLSETYSKSVPLKTIVTPNAVYRIYSVDFNILVNNIREQITLRTNQITDFYQR